MGSEMCIRDRLEVAGLPDRPASLLIVTPTPTPFSAASARVSLVASLGCWCHTETTPAMSCRTMAGTAIARGLPPLAYFVGNG